METNQELEKLMSEFDSLPKMVRQPTYLELCQYPYRRLEEICSKLLSFYLQPANEHGLHDLFIQSLVGLVGGGSELLFSPEGLQVIVEDDAEGKRIDIVVIGDNFVIGIENKITASLYNPLDRYRDKLLLYKKDHTIGIVLSLRKVFLKNELHKIRENAFKNILYSELFESIKENIGFYLTQSSDKYFSFLKDFIETIENMDGNNMLNQPLSNFFFDNAEKIDELMALYNKFNSRVKEKQNQYIASLRESASERTGHKWWVWSGFDLGCDFKVEGHKIGIEAHYKKAKRNPTGKFVIQITTWSVKDWRFFQDRIVALLPTKEVSIKDGRALLSYDTLLDADEHEIVERLQEAFTLLQKAVTPQV